MFIRPRLLSRPGLAGQRSIRPQAGRTSAPSGKKLQTKSSRLRRRLGAVYSDSMKKISRSSRSFSAQAISLIFFCFTVLLLPGCNNSDKDSGGKSDGGKNNEKATAGGGTLCNFITTNERNEQSLSNCLVDLKATPLQIQSTSNLNALGSYAGILFSTGKNQGELIQLEPFANRGDYELQIADLVLRRSDLTAYTLLGRLGSSQALCALVNPSAVQNKLGANDLIPSRVTFHTNFIRTSIYGRYINSMMRTQFGSGLLLVCFQEKFDKSVKLDNYNSLIQGLFSVQKNQ